MNTRGPTTRLIFLIWIALLALLLLSWAVAKVSLGPWNIVAAMTIAVAKMLLVILVFMHVRYSTHLTWVFVAAGFFWLFLMVTLALSDYLTRAGLPFR